MSFDNLPLIDGTDEQIQISFIEAEAMGTVDVQDGRRLKAGDTAPELTVVLLDEEKEPRQIPDSTTVIFGAKKRDFDSEVDSTEYLTSGYSAPFENYAEGEVVDDTKGIVSFDWADADTTNQSGTYDTEFRLIWTDDDDDENIEAFPSDGFTEVTITESL